MPTFDTPEPISVTVEFGVGDLRIVASDRTDTMVEVRPSDPPEGRRDRRRADPRRVRRRQAADQGPQELEAAQLARGRRVDRRAGRAAGGLTPAR